MAKHDASRVRDLMSSEVTTLERNDRLSEAESFMKLKRIRHLPVLDEYGRLAGVVSQRDLFFSGLLWALGYGKSVKDKTLAGLAVKEVMSENVITIGPDAPLSEAAALMTEKKVGCLPVVEGEKLLGILTESDFVATFVADTAQVAG